LSSINKIITLSNRFKFKYRLASVFSQLIY
jgi:hypothetical protein